MQFLLDYVRPDYLLLRVLSRRLVLWDSIQPTRAFVEGCCPPLVLEFALGKQVRRCLSPCCTPIRPVCVGRRCRRGDRSGPFYTPIVACRRGFSTVDHPIFLVLQGGEDDPLKAPVDRQLLRQAYVNIVAGACMAIGLR